MTKPNTNEKLTIAAAIALLVVLLVGLYAFSSIRSSNDITGNYSPAIHSNLSLLLDAKWTGQSDGNQRELCDAWHSDEKFKGALVASYTDPGVDPQWVIDFFNGKCN